MAMSSTTMRSARQIPDPGHGPERRTRWLRPCRRRRLASRGWTRPPASPSRSRRGLGPRPGVIYRSRPGRRSRGSRPGRSISGWSGRPGRRSGWRIPAVNCVPQCRSAQVIRSVQCPGSGGSSPHPHRTGRRPGRAGGAPSSCLPMPRPSAASASVRRLGQGCRGATSPRWSGVAGRAEYRADPNRTMGGGPQATAGARRGCEAASYAIA
jgi:hypothetical protein